MCAYQNAASRRFAFPARSAATTLGNIFTPASSYTKSAPRIASNDFKSSSRASASSSSSSSTAPSTSVQSNARHRTRFASSSRVRFASMRRRNHANAPPATISVNTTRSTAPRRASAHPSQPFPLPSSSARGRPRASSPPRHSVVDSRNRARRRAAGHVNCPVVLNDVVAAYSSAVPPSKSSLIGAQ